MILIPLMLACNYYRNGVFDGLLRAIDLGADCETLKLESPYLDRHLRLEIGENEIKIGKTRTWPIRGHREWVGNWCYDCVWVTSADAAEIVNFLFSKKYRAEVWDERLTDVVDGKAPITAVLVEMVCKRERTVR